MNYKQELPWSPLVNPRWPLNLLLGLLPVQDFWSTVSEHFGSLSIEGTWTLRVATWNTKSPA